MGRNQRPLYPDADKGILAVIGCEEVGPGIYKGGWTEPDLDYLVWSHHLLLIHFFLPLAASVEDASRFPSAAAWLDAVQVAR